MNNNNAQRRLTMLKNLRILIVVFLVFFYAGDTIAAKKKAGTKKPRARTSTTAKKRESGADVLGIKSGEKRNFGTVSFAEEDILYVHITPEEGNPFDIEKTAIENDGGRTWSKKRWGARNESNNIRLTSKEKKEQKIHKPTFVGDFIKKEKGKKPDKTGWKVEGTFAEKKFDIFMKPTVFGVKDEQKIPYAVAGSNDTDNVHRECFGIGEEFEVLAFDHKRKKNLIIEDIVIIKHKNDILFLDEDEDKWEYRILPKESIPDNPADYNQERRIDITMNVTVKLNNKLVTESKTFFVYYPKIVFPDKNDKRIEKFPLKNIDNDTCQDILTLRTTRQGKNSTKSAKATSDLKKAPKTTKRSDKKKTGLNKTNKYIEEHYIGTYFKIPCVYLEPDNVSFNNICITEDECVSSIHEGYFDKDETHLPSRDKDTPDYNSSIKKNVSSLPDRIYRFEPKEVFIKNCNIYKKNGNWESKKQGSFVWYIPWKWGYTDVSDDNLYTFARVKQEFTIECKDLDKNQIEVIYNAKKLGLDNPRKFTLDLNERNQ